MKTKVLERDVLKAVWGLLQTKYRHGHWDRVSSPVRLFNDKRHGGKITPVKTGSKGMADIIGVLHSQYIAIECKRPLGPHGGDAHSHLNDDQEAWCNAVVKAGGLYIIARSPEDVDKVLAEIDL